jgi:hypothetical protein
VLATGAVVVSGPGGLLVAGTDVTAPALTTVVVVGAAVVVVVGAAVVVVVGAAHAVENTMYVYRVAEIPFGHDAVTVSFIVPTTSPEIVVVAVVVAGLKPTVVLYPETE